MDLLVAAAGCQDSLAAARACGNLHSLNHTFYKSKYLQMCPKQGLTGLPLGTLMLESHCNALT